MRPEELRAAHPQVPAAARAGIACPMSLTAVVAVSPPMRKPSHTVSASAATTAIAAATTNERWSGTWTEAVAFRLLPFAAGWVITI